MVGLMPGKIDLLSFRFMYYFLPIHLLLTVLCDDDMRNNALVEMNGMELSFKFSTLGLPLVGKNK